MKNSATPAVLDLDDLLKAVESAKSYASVASESQPVQIRIASENSREGGGGDSYPYFQTAQRSQTKPYHRQAAFLKGWIQALIPTADQSALDAVLDEALRLLFPSEEQRDSAYFALTVLDNPIVQATSIAVCLNFDRQHGFCRALASTKQESL